MEQTYSNYTNRILNLRQAKIHGEVIVAKPVLLLALIDGIGQGIFKENRFVLNEWLDARYLKLMAENTRHSQFDKPADIANPFWHLATDGFWHLHGKNVLEMKPHHQKNGSKRMLTTPILMKTCGFCYKTSHGEKNCATL